MVRRQRHLEPPYRVGDLSAARCQLDEAHGTAAGDGDGIAQVDGPVDNGGGFQLGFEHHVENLGGERLRKPLTHLLPGQDAVTRTQDLDQKQ
jgi:hypothetical protein